MPSAYLQNLQQLEILAYKFEILNIPIQINKDTIELQYSELDSVIVEKFIKNLLDEKIQKVKTGHFKKRF